MMSRRPPPDLISVVTPCFNEAGSLAEFVSRVAAVLRPAGQRFEIVFVNDGSSDDTLLEMSTLAEAGDDISIVNLTRNFGKEIALTAGIAHAAGDAIVVIDCDLQDPPELILSFIDCYRRGYDIAYGRRTQRNGDTWLKKVTARQFYRVMRSLGPVQLPENVGDFRLISRRAADALLRLPEAHRFMKGLFAWIGYPSVAVDYVREPRFSGQTKWNYGKLFNLSIEGVTSFTTIPLRLTTYLGFTIATAAFLGGAAYFFRTLFFGEEVRGFPTLFLTVLLLGGTQLIALGVIGEYLGRVFNETKQRPLFLVESVRWSSEARMRAQRSPQADPPHLAALRPIPAQYGVEATRPAGPVLAGGR